MSDPRRDETFQHKLEQFDPGMVWLDASNRVIALNDVAIQVLGPSAEQSFGVRQDNLVGIDVLQLHPDKSRDKLRLLLREHDGAGCPVKSPPPVAMMINTPDRVLMIKVSKMVGEQGACGTCMIFYDLTDITTAPSESPEIRAHAPRRLLKIPVYRRNRMILIDLHDIVRFEGEGHYTAIVTRDSRHLSNLSLTDLELRLDPDIYFRAHRSHIINLNFATEVVRDEESVSVLMADKESTYVPVSRTKSARLKELLGIA